MVVLQHTLPTFNYCYKNAYIPTFQIDIIFNILTINLSTQIIIKNTLNIVFLKTKQKFLTAFTSEFWEVISSTLENSFTKNPMGLGLSNIT